MQLKSCAMEKISGTILLCPGGIDFQLRQKENFWSSLLYVGGGVFTLDFFAF